MSERNRFVSLTATVALTLTSQLGLAQNASPARDRNAPPERPASLRDWTLAPAAVVHAPIDYGFEVLGETPFGLRVSAGYGIVPSAYGSLFSDLVSSLTTEPRARATLNGLDFSGHVWRASLGLRPFERLGLYLDAGYARAVLDAALLVDSSEVAELGSLSAGYSLRTRVDSWFFELGYEAHLGRFLLAGGLGLTRSFASQSSLTALGAAPTSSLESLVTQRIDQSIERYGYTPTLSLRLGFDLL